MSGRKSPFKRANNNFTLQIRDKELFVSLCRYEYLTNDQIKALFNFGCLTRVNTRLRKLYDNNYLSRAYISNLCGQAKIVHFIGPEAVPIVAEKLKVDPLIIKRKRQRLLKAKESVLIRSLLINKVRLAFELAERYRPEIKMNEWKQVALKGDSTFYPEAYFAYQYNGKRYNFFLEIDHSIRSGKAFKDRLQKYLKYGMEGYFNRQFGFNFFRVLFVCSSQDRLKTLFNITSRLTDRMFWFATIEQMTSENVFNAIWLRPGKQEKHSLLEVN
ncbi:MAG: replication-relaxation family protein [bacterium]|nr:replication-relaxation family protein [bacterium]